MAVMVGRLAMMFSVVGGKRVGRHEVAADRGMRWWVPVEVFCFRIETRQNYSLSLVTLIMEYQ